MKKISKPITFLSANPMWGIGLEDIFDDYKIFCGKNYFSQNFLRNSNLSLFEIENIKSTNEIFLNLSKKNIQVAHYTNHSKNKQNERKKSHQQKFAKKSQPEVALEGILSTFKPEKIWKKISKNFPKVNYILEQNIDVAEKIENKIKFFEIAKILNLQIPKTEILPLTKENFENFSEKFNSFVLQFPFSAAGLGTYIFKNQNIKNTKNKNKELEKIFLENEGRITKFSEFIKGKNLTINACTTKFGTLVSFPFAQITGILKLGGGNLSSNGTDFSFKISKKVAEKCRIETKKIGDFLYKNGFKGIFGVDFLLSEAQEIFTIEVNPRIVFSIPFFTKLEILKGRTPLLFFHYAELLNEKYEMPENQIEKSFEQISGSQIIWRDGSIEKNFKNLETGIYDENLNFLKTSIEPKDLKKDEFLLIVNSEFDFSHNEILRIQSLERVLEKNSTTKLNKKTENFLQKLSTFLNCKSEKHQ